MKLFTTYFRIGVAILLIGCVTSTVIGQTAPVVDSDLPPTPRMGAAIESSQLPVKRHEFTKQGGVVYCPRESGDLKCDVYVPKGDGPFPSVLCVHGGAWRSGSKLHYLRHAWELAGRGFVVVAINYRHAPSHKFPAQVHDCKYAVRWMRHHAEKYKINPNQIMAFGYSAGGNLVAMLGATQPKDGLEGDVPDELQPYSSAIQAVVAGGAPCEFSWTGNYALTYWLGSSKRGNPKIYERASPVTYLDAKDPPVYLFHGSIDGVVPISSPRKMKDKLDALGVKAKLDIVKTGHIATFNDLDCLDRALEFFDALSSAGKE